jgi:hypothetical protein
MVAAFRSLTLGIVAGGALLLLLGPPPPLQAEEATIGSLAPAAVTRLAEELSPKVERWRGAMFEEPVGVRVIDAAEARRRLTLRLTDLWPEERIRADSEALRQLGLLPNSGTLVDSILSSLDGQLSGFYDPPSKTLFLLDTMPQDSAPLIVVHELTHALDDQHHGLDALIQACGPDDDRVTALSSLFEGSAMLAMSAYVAETGMDGTRALAALTRTAAAQTGQPHESPVYVQRSLLAPYLLGERLLVDPPRGVDLGAARARLARAFADPPVSTEQLIHPEKYWELARRDMPRPVALRDLSQLLGQDWSLRSTGTLGELILAILTGAPALDLSGAQIFETANWTNAGAAGWGGDLYHHYSNGQRSVTLLATVWDTPEDAREFEAALVPQAGGQSVRERSAVVLLVGDCAPRCGSLLGAAQRSLRRKR